MRVHTRIENMFIRLLSVTYNFIYSVAEKSSTSCTPKSDAVSLKMDYFIQKH